MQELDSLSSHDTSVSVGILRFPSEWLRLRRLLCRGLVLATSLFSIAGNARPAVGSSTTVPTVIEVMPTVGGVGTIVRLNFVADTWDDQFGGDTVSVVGPSATACAGTVVGAENVAGNPHQGIRGPHRDGSGPAVVYIGPGADLAYPWEPNAYDPASFERNSHLSRWCPGTYNGAIFAAGPLTTTPKATFRFRIDAATGARRLPRPAVARHLRQVNVAPGKGAPASVFAVRYEADADLYARGDVVEVNGPKRSACNGSVAGGNVGMANARGGSVTLHIGPGVDAHQRWYDTGYAYPRVSDDGNGRMLRHWCSGTYDGTILYENGATFTVIARFDLHVA